MGLLNDAIREHLELKRLRGADPGEVAREEHDALGPVRREDGSEHGGQEDTETQLPSDADRSVSPDSEWAPPTDSSVVGQETVEINMDAELATGTDAGHDPEAMGDERGAPTGSAAHKQAGAEESLEWEMPGDHPDEPVDGAGMEGEADSRVDDNHDENERVEDVLEETPDFLRDTPEQERLWFEQRPPRDFDFNE
ncbi:MAG TPA: hypothetical protein VFV03_04760 [Solirubrobacteraceae bacterium]|nr:hypothetical protein [Solirubrobacteraceae bacterium]